MSPQPTAEPLAEDAPDTGGAGLAWLLFVHQLPASPSHLRVRTWRRLQQIGAIAVKQAVYVLPDAGSAREDFEWLKTEVESAGGHASVFAAASVDAWSDDGLVEEFRRARQEAYAALADEIAALLQKLETAGRRPRRPLPVARLLEGFRERFAAIERIDFFGSAGRDRVAALIGDVEERASPGRREAPATGRVADPAAYRRRLWVTRPRPGVDRMSSAWLIRRFIDPQASFAFAIDRGAVPSDAVAFDMFGVEFTHQADRCTFETFCLAFGIEDPAVHRLGTIVHDLDLKDGRFAPAEASTVAMVIEGLQLALADDDELLAHGMMLFEALYRAAAQTTRHLGPRAVAGRRGGQAGSHPARRPRAR